MPNPTNESNSDQPVQSKVLLAINDFIGRFADRVGTELDPLDDTGFSELRYGNLAVGITANPEHDLLLFLVPVDELPNDASSAFYRHLLALNFTATGPCAFAIDEERKRLCLRILRPLTGLSYQEFEQLLQTIASVGETMLAHLKQLAEQEHHG